MLEETGGLGTRHLSETLAYNETPAKANENKAIINPHAGTRRVENCMPHRSRTDSKIEQLLPQGAVLGDELLILELPQLPHLPS